MIVNQNLSPVQLRNFEDALDCRVIDRTQLILDIFCLLYTSTEGVKHAVMAGQVKHNKIFSAVRPDWKLAKVIFSLSKRNTNSLIGAVAKVLQEEGIELVDSTTFLAPLIPGPGVLTQRAPDAEETADVAYGRSIARQIAGLDLGQTVVVRDRACVAIEAMELSLIHI